MRAASERARAAWRSLLSLAVAVLVAGPVLLACGSPPQILEITPAKGAQDVPTNLAIRIRFDRPLDRASVARRFTLRPSVVGAISWEAQNTMVFTHESLQPSTTYTVDLLAGYRDTAGNVNGFNHSWTFKTEPPPVVRASTPGQGERGVDPSTYVALTFTRDMDADTFRSAVTFSPPTTFAVQIDPTDARRVLIAPQSLLQPDTTYDVTVGGDATDADGNHLGAVKLRFVTGPVRSLSHWITFVASPGAEAAGAGVWMVDEAGFPRLLEQTAVDTFSWSPDGSNLLVRHPDLSWTDYPLGSQPVELSFSAAWAAYLGRDSGYIYLDGEWLRRRLPNGEDLAIASGATAAAVSHDLNRVAFVELSPSGAEIRAYDVALRAQYRLQRELGQVTELVWAPDGTKLAYLVTGPAGQSILKVKSLTGPGAVSTVATGSISALAWLANSSEVTFAARIPAGSAGGQSRIFRANTALAPVPLTVANAIGPATDANSFLPRPSPDGHQIAFLVGAPETAQVWLMNADGTGSTRLTGFDSASFPYACRDLHWAVP